MILIQENWFLITIGIIWIIGAIIQDLHRREVDNIWNFSLIGIALAYRFSNGVFSGNYWFVINGFLGLGVFLLLGNLFYYSRLFAGGDAKLLIALGAILPLSYSWITNFKIFGMFVFVFMLGGSIYSLFYSCFLIIGNFSRFNFYFMKYFKRNYGWFVGVLLFSLIWAIFSFFIGFAELILISLIVLLFPVLLVFSKAVEESCLIKEVSYDRVTEGDWLIEDIRVGGKVIKASWRGLSRKELGLIKRARKNVKIKYGIPFTPAFLIGFVGVLLLSWYGWF